MRDARGPGRWLLALLAVTLVVGAGAGEKEIADGIDVYFRDVDLAALSPQALPRYREAEPGESERLERAYPGAPPQIPHSLEDLLPIEAEANECLECHHPENATDEGEIPLPDSHFEHAVMAAGPGPMLWVVTGYREVRDEFGSRYNCTMCHAPQATNVNTPASRFVIEKPSAK